MLILAPVYASKKTTKSVSYHGLESTTTQPNQQLNGNTEDFFIVLVHRCHIAIVCRVRTLKSCSQHIHCTELSYITVLEQQFAGNSSVIFQLEYCSKLKLSSV